MPNKKSRQLRERIVEAANTVLDRNGTVGPLELLQAVGFLHPVHVQGWRRGNEHYTPLEPWIHCGAEKLQDTYRFFAEWTRDRGLQPMEADLVRRGVGGMEELQVTADGDPQREQFFRTYYAPAEISPRKTEQIKKKLTKPPDLVVYILTSESSECGDCGTELLRGDFLFMEKGQPLCLACADMDHLEFLPSGDAALTRRARKHSPLSAVVVQFSRRRKRYERQGILVTPAAIARAEAECAGDADERAARRQVDARRRERQDIQLVDEMTATILERYPNCPPDEARQIAEHTAVRGSGRVGRSAAGRALSEIAIDLAVIASIRHNHTNYDSLLMKGVERQSAREMVRDQIVQRVDEWSKDKRPKDKRPID